MATVRVYDDPKDKRKFTRKTLFDFPARIEEFTNFKKAVFSGTKECFSDDRELEIDDVEVGYVGATNNKFYVRSDDEVDEAYESRTLRKYNELVLFIEERKVPKRKLSDAKGGKLINARLRL